MSWLSSAFHTVTNAIVDVGQSLGIIPKAEAPPPPPTPPAAPTAANSYQAMDESAQAAAAAVSRGRTSTYLTGASGVEEDDKNTSRILLGT